MEYSYLGIRYVTGGVPLKMTSCPERGPRRLISPERMAPHYDVIASTTPYKRSTVYLTWCGVCTEYFVYYLEHTVQIDS